MKRFILLICLVLSCFLMTGCSGIVADARHAALIDLTAASATVNSSVADLPDSCKDDNDAALPACECVGGFSKAQVRELFRGNAELWKYFQQAKSGHGQFPTGGEQ